MRFFLGIMVGSGLTYWSITGYPMATKVVHMLIHGATTLTRGYGQ